MKFLIGGLLFLSCSAIGQSLHIENLHYKNYFTSDSTNQITHTGIKPYVVLKNTRKTSGFCLPLKNSGLLYPIIDLGIGIDNLTNEIIDAGVGLNVDFQKPKFAITGKILPYYHVGGYVRDSIFSQSQIDISTGRSIGKNSFVQGELLVAFRPNKFFLFMGGIGKNSFGEGYRSLLLSDNAASNPFLKIETSFWSIKYVNLFNVWNDFYASPNNNKDVTKLSAIHYLSWNITNSFNLSVFETVVWQAKDSLTNRYFEPNYMNPFVLYRPVEYAQGSADNVLLGLNLSYKPTKKATIYSQLILDEFYLAEIRAGNQWWANKFGVQFGVKSQQFLIPHLFGQLEVNLVRPFTYSHKQSAQSYGHANASVTHPLGANFYEINSILSYQINKHQITAQFAYSLFGTDSSSISYGQNIFESYSNRSGNYNHKIGQGVQQNVFSANLYYDYPLKHIPNLYFTCRYKLRLSTSEKYFNHNQSFEVGIRSRIWNRNDDY